MAAHQRLRTRPSTVAARARARATGVPVSADVRPSFNEPDFHLLASLRVDVREAYRPGRWLWQIIDVRDGSVFEREFEFESADDACRAGLARLAELRPSLPGAKAVGRSIDSSPMRVVIVSRTQNAMYQELQRLFRDNRSIELIRDRRGFDRRGPGRRRQTERRPSAPFFERRARHRRSGTDRRTMRIDEALRARGWCLVPREESGPPTIRSRATA